MDGWMNGWMDGGMDGWRDGWMDGGMDGWMDGWVDGGMDGGMDGWMDGGMERGRSIEQEERAADAWMSASLMETWIKTQTDRKTCVQDGHREIEQDIERNKTSGWR